MHSDDVADDSSGESLATDVGAEEVEFLEDWVEDREGCNGEGGGDGANGGNFLEAIVEGVAYNQGHR